MCAVKKPAVVRLLSGMCMWGLCLGAGIAQAQRATSGASSVRFAAFGDFGQAGPNELAVANLVDSFQPDFCVTTGDNSYGTGAIDLNVGQYYSDYIGAYEGAYGTGSATNRFFPSLGNHDYTDGAGLNAYLGYFSLPGAGIPGSGTSGNERYYDFVQGPVHFFVIDSNPAGLGSPASPGDGRSPDSPQGVWLQTRLAQSTSPWKIVYMHHPPFSSSASHGSEVEMQWPYEAWGATAVLSGHDHLYERILRDANADGVDMPYFVPGAGGKSLYAFSTPVAGSEARYNANYGSMIIDADESGINFRFHSINPADGNNGLIDSYTIGTAPPVYTPAAGDVIIAAVQSWNNPVGQNPGEFVELFNTTGQPIPLAGLQLVSRLDNDSDGVVEVDWQLAPDLSTAVIAPYGFFLIAESGVVGEDGVRDLTADLDLATGEGGSAERAISLELAVGGTHLDYVLYGRHDGQAPAGALPPGDRAFNGTSWPRTEVIRNTTGDDNFQEGLLRRESPEALHAGHDVEGYYTDEAALGDGYPTGVWYSPHDDTFGSYTARNSTSLPVPPGGNRPPDAPVLIAPANAAVDVRLTAQLRVNVSDPDLDGLNVTYFGRPVVTAAAENFTIIPLPDTQNYSATYPSTFLAQTQWVVDNIASRNIVYLAHEGDVVEHAATASEWIAADAALRLLEDPEATGLPDGLSFGIAPGNHDQPTDLYNTYFGTSRFSGRGYYGGSYLADNDNSYSLFSAGGMDFIVVNLENGASAGAIAWADALFQTFSERRGIVVSHYLLEANGAWSSAGATIYGALKDNPNVFLMLCGHIHAESRRTDTYLGHTIHTVLADYQDMANGGNGWLRIMEFRPSANQIVVQTYSPTLDQYGTATVPGYDTASREFTLAYDMGGSLASFTELGMVEEVAGSGEAVVAWSGLAPRTAYEWYVEVSDGFVVTTSPLWSFTTGDVSGVADGMVPTRLETGGNYPNPFNPSTRIKFALPSNGRVEITLFDLQGRVVRTLVDREYPLGNHEVVWDGRDGNDQLVPSGTYIYRVEAGGAVASGKMMLMK